MTNTLQHVREMIEKKLDGYGMADYGDRAEIVLEELLSEIDSLPMD